MDSDSEVFITLFRSSSSIRSTDTNGVYIVRDVSDFYSSHCKLGYDKSFRSIKIKTAYKDNKIYIKTAKLEARKEVFTLAKCTYRIYKISFKSYNKLFRHLKNRCVKTTLFVMSSEILLSETSSEFNIPDIVHRMLDISLLILLVVPVFEQKYIVRENKPFE